MKTRAAFLPVTAKTLPVVLYMAKHSEKYEIITLLSYPGCGAIGRDAGHIDNRGDTGFIVSDNLLDSASNWNILLIADNTVDRSDDFVLRSIIKALSLGKEVICSAMLSALELQIIGYADRKSVV